MFGAVDLVFLGGRVSELRRFLQPAKAYYERNADKLPFGLINMLVRMEINRLSTKLSIKTRLITRSITQVHLSNVKLAINQN